MTASENRWFSRLARAQRERLLAAGLKRKAKAGTVVLRRGAAAEELFVVLEGKAKAAIIDANGKGTTFEILGPHDLFGEVGLFGRGVRTADLTALEACEFLVLDEPAIVSCIREDPSIAFELLGVLAERVVRLSNTIEEASALDAGTRLARSLLKLAERFGSQSVPQNLQVSLRLSQQDLADLVGVSRVLANTKLKTWERAGILTHRSGRLLVHNLDALRKVAAM